MIIVKRISSEPNRLARFAGVMLVMALVFCLCGCRTTGGSDWEKRIGVATFTDAVSELGQPDRSVELSDGSLVAQWLYRKGEDRLAHKILYGTSVSDFKDEPRMSDKYLNLTFDPTRKLAGWQWSYK